MKTKVITIKQNGEKNEMDLDVFTITIPALGAAWWMNVKEVILKPIRGKKIRF